MTFASVRKKVTHITTVHARDDVRIFLKECRSLVKHGYELCLIVADGNGSDIVDGVEIIDVGKETSRFRRIIRSPQKVLSKALNTNADLYHLHDPELLAIANTLKRYNKKVVFDSHEDFPKQLLHKPYLSPVFRSILYYIAEIYEKRVCSKLDGIIAATPSIEAKFIPINSSVININNFPLPEEIEVSNVVRKRKSNVFCYAGGISKSRGIIELVQALGILNGQAHLILCGEFMESGLIDVVSKLYGWKFVDYVGKIDRSQLLNVFSTSLAGIVTFKNIPNHINSQPNKMFEYMASNLPVVGSDFPLWRKIIVDLNCGVSVNPEDPSSIAEGMRQLISSPSEAREMGHNGKQAVLTKFNWELEELELINYYSILMGAP